MKKEIEMNGTVAILALLDVMAIVCWIYFRMTDNHHINVAE